MLNFVVTNRPFLVPSCLGVSIVFSTFAKLIGLLDAAFVDVRERLSGGAHQDLLLALR